MAEDELADLLDLNKPAADPPPAGASLLVGVVSNTPGVAGGEPLGNFTGHRSTPVSREQTVAYLEATLEVVSALCRTT